MHVVDAIRSFRRRDRRIYGSFSVGGDGHTERGGAPTRVASRKPSVKHRESHGKNLGLGLGLHKRGAATSTSAARDENPNVLATIFTDCAAMVRRPRRSCQAGDRPVGRGAPDRRIGNKPRNPRTSVLIGSDTSALVTLFMVLSATRPPTDPMASQPASREECLRPATEMPRNGHEVIAPRSRSRIPTVMRTNASVSGSGAGLVPSRSESRSAGVPPPPSPDLLLPDTSSRDHEPANTCPRSRMTSRSASN
jgi:hypothetical protein